MRTAGMIFLVVFGGLTLKAVPLLGVIMVGTGIWLGSRVRHEDMTRFMGLLFLLGAIGFVAAFFVGVPASIR